MTLPRLEEGSPWLVPATRTSEAPRQGYHNALTPANAFEQRPDVDEPSPGRSTEVAPLWGGSSLGFPLAAGEERRRNPVASKYPSIFKYSVKQVESTGQGVILLACWSGCSR